MRRGLVRSVGALAAAALIALSGALALPATAEAQTNVLVSNIGQAAESTSQNVTRRAQAFTTGSHMDGYNLSSIELDFDTARIAVTVSLHSTGTDGNSGKKVYDLSSPRIPTAGNPFSGPTAFAAPSGATLTADTTYFVEIQSATRLVVAVWSTASTTEDAGAAMDWSIADVRSTYSSGTWSDTAGPIKIRVNGRGPDEPTNFRATAGESQVALTWDPPASGSGVTHHDYRFKTDGSYGNWIEINDSGRGEINASSFTVTMGIVNDTAYTFQLRAVSAAGDGPEAEAGPVTPTTAPIPTVTSVAVVSAPPSGGTPTACTRRCGSR